MIALFLFLLFMFAALGTGFLAAVSDARGLKIPNMHTIIVVCAFFGCYGSVWLFSDVEIFASITSHLMGAGIVFVITFILFALKAIGAADSKLGAAYALWVAMPGLPAFLFYMSVVGGILGLLSLVIKAVKPFKNPPAQSWVGQLQNGDSKVPYGIAIVIGAAGAFLHLGYFDLSHMVQMVSS